MRGAGAAVLLIALAGCGGERAMSADEVAAELHNLTIAPGLWETTSAVTEASGPNMPVSVRADMLRHRRAVRHCITPEQAAEPAANFLQMQAGNACTYYGFSIRDGRMRGTMICTGGGMPGTVTTTIEGRYRPDGVDIVMRMNAAGQPQGADTNMAMRTTGRRIGACPAVQTETQEGARP